MIKGSPLQTENLNTFYIDLYYIYMLVLILMIHVFYVIRLFTRRNKTARATLYEIVISFRTL